MGGHRQIPHSHLLEQVDVLASLLAKGILGTWLPDSGIAAPVRMGCLIVTPAPLQALDTAPLWLPLGEKDLQQQPLLPVREWQEDMGKHHSVCVSLLKFTQKMFLH